MENNNTPRKARIYYKGESIPVLVEAEDDRIYDLLLDWDRLMEVEDNSLVEAMRKRKLYLAALGWKGSHQAQETVLASMAHMALYKNKLDVTLVFDETEPDEGQDVPVDSTDIEDVQAQIDIHGELYQHLTLFARSGYKVKSFDVNIQEGGEAHLCATFTK
jgi:hypothetical protein